MRIEKTTQKTKGSGGQNRKAGDNFMDKNRNKPGVIETESGLQYIIINKTEGETPTKHDTVSVNQRITLINGSLISDTFSTGEADIFPMKQAINGLKEGLMMMAEGSRYRFFIPPDLAWGKRGAGQKIGPFATLIFDVRLESIEF